MAPAGREREHRNPVAAAGTAHRGVVGEDNPEEVHHMQREHRNPVAAVGIPEGEEHRTAAAAAAGGGNLVEEHHRAVAAVEDILVGEHRKVVVDLAGEHHRAAVAVGEDTLAEEGRRTAAVEDTLLEEEGHHTGLEGAAGIDREEVHRNRVVADTAVVPEQEAEETLMRQLA